MVAHSSPGQLDETSARAALNGHATKDRHVGLFGTECAQRHQAPPSHYMMYFDMISKKIAGQEDERVAGCCGAAQVNQCYRCHQTTSWNDIRAVGYYKHR